MAETPLTSLPLRLQKQFENARTALSRENPEYAVNICRDILARHPGCLAIRRYMRAIQLKRHRERNPLMARVAGGMGATMALAGFRSRLKRDAASALEVAERALGADPTSVQALRALGEAAIAMNLGETAVFALEAAREKARDNRKVLVELAAAYVAAGRSEEALSITERLLRENPADGELQELVKRASVEQSIAAGRWESGSGTYRDKLRDEQQAVSIEHSNKFITSPEMARRLIEEAIERANAEPDNLVHYRNVISGYRSLGQIDDALDWILRARERPVGRGDPTFEKVQSELRIERAQSLLDRRMGELVGEENPEDDATIIRLRGELARVKSTELRSLADKYPNEHNYRFELGEHYRATGEIDLAIQQYQAAQRGPKMRTRSLAALGACFQAKNLHDLAVEQFELIKKELPAVNDEKKDIVYRLAQSYEAMGQRERALAEYKLIYSWDIAFRDVAAKIDSFYSKS